ncbi:SDR family oxidoreductase [Curtobacterium flaccumfaciens]|nr:SDR family oxidoreductase [Curtobacterium flaccumfaciens]
MDAGGRIVVVTSYGSLRAFPTYAALGAAKAMSEAYTKYMAVEFGPRQITVNAVNGGLIDTDSLEYFYSKVAGQAPMQSVIEKLPLQRPGTADDMADAVDFLLSDKASYITGQTLSVDGGLTVIAPPYWADTTSPLRDAVLPRPRTPLRTPPPTRQSRGMSTVAVHDLAVVSSPWTLGPLHLSNRVVMGSMHTGLEVHDDGGAGMAAFYRERAAGGAACIITGGIAVNDEARAAPTSPCSGSGERTTGSARRWTPCTSRGR